MPHGTAFAPRSAETCLLENTSFVGRDRALAELLEAVDRERLTTLWGAAGVGKTRLLRRACAETTARGRVTVVEVMDLVPARDRAALVAAVAQALGISLADVGDEAAIPVVGDALARAGGMLLALDGLEHLVPHADVVATWLARAPELRVLCTSRTPLGLLGERALELEPLSIASGVALFEDRVRASTGRALGADEQAPAERIVRRVDGLPLAIELVAARAATLGVQQIEEQLAADHPTDGVERAAMMQAIVGWSVGLLGAMEQAALSDLGCCADGIASDLAEAVIDSDHPQAALQTLRKNTLVWTRHGRHGELRCGVYASVRDFLVDRGAPPARAIDRHARVLAAFAGPLAARARAEEPGALEALLDDAANLELALARTGDDETRATLALAAATVTHRRGSKDAHDALSARGLDAARAARLVEIELDLLERQSTLAAAAGEANIALACLEEAVAVSAPLENKARHALARAHLGETRCALGDLDRGLDDLHAAVSAAPEGSLALVSAHQLRGAARLQLGDARGLDELALAASLASHTPARTLRTRTLLEVARAQRQRGAVEVASQRLLEASALGPPPDETLRALFLLEQAALARVGGRFEDASALLRDARAAAEACAAPALRAEAHGLASALALDLDDVALALVEADAACAQAARMDTPRPRASRAPSRRSAGARAAKVRASSPSSAPSSRASPTAARPR